MLVNISEKSADGIHHHKPAAAAGIKIQMLRIWASGSGYAQNAEPGMTAISTLNRIYIRLGQRCSRTKGYRLSTDGKTADNFSCSSVLK